ncbi:MAG: extracellular solute-binding protein [Treponema sp.]|jgi:spermidine/putrescine transport system substrate-binding protein|nr:extracellular solute-binding protein [Treponema sp.]
MKRRIFSKSLHFCAAFVAVFLIVLFSGCSKDDGKTLYLFNWTYYMPDSVVKQFENEFGVKVKIDNYASNEEMYAKLKAGASGYDIIFPSQDYVSIMIKEGMLKEIDHSKLTNKTNISELVLEKAFYDPGMKYSVPYCMGAAGIVVNREKVSNYSKSWSIFADKSLNQRMSMLDDMREVLGAALISLGYSINTTNDAELAEAVELINKSWKPNLIKFDAEGFGKSFASGDFWVVHGYAEAVFDEVPEENWGKIDFFIPEEGGPMYIDSMCILKNSKHSDLAMEFINFIHRPEVYAMFLDQFRFPAGVNPSAAQYTTELPHYSVEELSKCEIIDDLAENLVKYSELWEEIRFED